jgi:hypothetical protein
VAAGSGIPERWTLWLEVLYRHIVELHHDSALWNELVEIIETNRGIPDPWFFLDWVGRLWASTMAVGIRRLDDRHPKSISLARLITDIGKHPELVSREHYRALYAETYPDDDWMQRRADEEYDENVGRGLDAPPVDLVKRDLHALRSAGATMRHHVNKYVAHTDEHAGPPTATYGDIDAALDGVTALYRRYSLLITGSAPSMMTPTLQFDSTQPFLVAWKPDDHYLEALRRQGHVPREDASRG